MNETKSKKLNADALYKLQISKKRLKDISKNKKFKAEEDQEWFKNAEEKLNSIIKLMS